MKLKSAQYFRTGSLALLCISSPLGSLFRPTSARGAHHHAGKIRDQRRRRTRPDHADGAAVSSVLGDARSVLDTPRSVSSINKELMQQVRIKSVTDFSQFSPGVYTAARYGLATTPMVRGDLAELYFNGQRAKYSPRQCDARVSMASKHFDIVRVRARRSTGRRANGAAGYTELRHQETVFRQAAHRTLASATAP